MKALRLSVKGSALACVMVVLWAVPADAADETNGPSAATQIPLQLYKALGSSMAQDSHLPDLGWDPQKIEAFVEGVKSAFDRKGEPPPKELADFKHQLDETIQALELHRRHETLATPAGLKQFLKKARKEASLRETDSGLCYRVLKPGPGVHPRLQDAVVVSFECRTADDMALVTSVHADHLRVKVADLLPGLREGLQMLTPDGELLLVVPPDLSFREGPWPTGVDAGMPLAFIVKLHEVIPATAER